MKNTKLLVLFAIAVPVFIAFLYQQQQPTAATTTEAVVPPDDPAVVAESKEAIVDTYKEPVPSIEEPLEAAIPNYDEYRILPKDHADHPYLDLDDEELGTLMSAGDAEAAVILAERIWEKTDGDYYEASTWFAIAAAIGEKSGPIIDFAEKSHQQAFVEIGGVRVPDPETTMRRLAFEIIAQKMGDPRADPEKWAAVLNALPEGDHWEGRAENEARTQMAVMINVQRDTLGSTQLRDLLLTEAN